MNQTGSDQWSSRRRSSWPRRCRPPSPCWRCRDWSTAPDRCSSGCHSWSRPSRGYSGTRRGDRFHDQSTSGPDSPLKTHKKGQWRHCFQTDCKNSSFTSCYKWKLLSRLKGTLSVSVCHRCFTGFKVDFSSFCSVPLTSSFTLYYRLFPIYWQHNYALL